MYKRCCVCEKTVQVELRRVFDKSVSTYLANIMKLLDEGFFVSNFDDHHLQ